MQKLMTDYLDRVSGSIRGSSIRQAARSELADHMRERYARYLNEGMNADVAALETVRRMGDAETLGRRITQANRPKLSALAAPFIGLGLFILAMTSMLWVGGGEFEWFVDIYCFIVVTVLAAAFGILSCKGKPTLSEFIRGVKSGALYAGGVVWVVGIMTTLNRMQEDPWTLGSTIAVAMTSLLYGLLLSAAARIAENHTAAPAAGAIKDLIEM